MGIRRATLTEVGPGAQIRGEEIPYNRRVPTDGPLMSPEPEVPLDYAGHGFKRFS
jgi:hypothetical protein